MAHEGFWHADIRPTQQWPATAHLFSHSVEARTMAEEKSAIIIMRRRTSKGPGMATETCMSNTVLRGFEGKASKPLCSSVHVF